jgi:hypothetical protein
VTCKEAAEFVSALFDGEIIPPDAARHIGACEACKLLLRDYAEMGAELRRVASIETAQPAPSLQVEPKARHPHTLWQKGRETMKIPKFAFALLILIVIALASSLTVIGVGAHSSGNVLVLNVELSGRDHPFTGVFDTTRSGPQPWTVIGRMNQKFAGFQFELLARSGDRVQLGFRSKANPLSADGHNRMGGADVRSQPQSQYWFEPGKTLTIDMQDVGTFAVTGEWMDHTPVFYHNPALMGETMDPNAEELRLVSPLLLRNKEVIADMSDTAKATAPGDAIFVFSPPLGRYLISLEPMKGAVEANVHLNRITFEMNGQEEAFVAGAPVTRAHTVWVLYEPDFKPPSPDMRGYVVGSGKLSAIAPEAALPAPPPGK